MKNNQGYIEYFKPSRIIQTRLVTFMTAFFYVLYSFIDKEVLPAFIANEASFLHLYIITPILISISLLTFSKNFYSFGVYLLMLSPIIAGIGNFYIVTNVPTITGYLVETYLIIFWLFTLSGLNFKQALFSLLIILLVTTASSIFMSTLDSNILIVHSFWIICSSSFGLLIAYLIDKQNRTIYDNYIKLKKYVLIDDLTQIYNRRKIEEFLPSEIKRCKRFFHTFSFVMIDIDFFKEVNDLYGHNTGDIVLKEMVNLINKHLRATDVFIRWGGEEFIIICLETSLDEVKGLLNRIKDAVQEKEFKEIGKRTISMGAVSYKHGDTIKSLLNRSDKALYEAKDSGRNQIIFN